MLLLKDQCWSEPDGRLPAPAGVHPKLAQFQENSVPPLPTVAVDSTEGASAPGTVEESGEPGLEVEEPVHQNFARSNRRRFR